MNYGLIFLAGLAAGFFLCVLLARRYFSKTRKILKDRQTLEMQNQRLLNTLRYSGGRIHVYKEKNKYDLEKIRHYQNMIAEISQVLRG